MAGIQRVLIGVAWPYASGPLHVGHLAGCYLPADIFARFQRLYGRDVLMVSGSDTHGTPISLAAQKAGITPQALVEHCHQAYLDDFTKLGISFDLFTHTNTVNHWQCTHEFFLDHLKKGYLYKDTQKQLYDPKAEQFLADRYVEGICPRCGTDGARGDQCDHCGSTYDPTELKQPRSAITGSQDLEIKTTEHFFLDLAKLNEPLIAWINQNKAHWRPHVLNFTKTQLEKRELRGRPITRDLEWGISVPLPEYKGKCIYVWYEAVIGYYSAPREWAALSGNPEAWREYWDPKLNSSTRSYYFIGKDNIEFHSIIWPAMLHGHGNLNLPYDVPANEYLNSYGRKFSKSRGTMITVAELLAKYEPDACRYVFNAIAPETSDADFTWDDFYERVNNELVANWGNLCNRVLGFADKSCDGKVPVPETAYDATDERLLREVEGGFTKVAQLYDAVKLRGAGEEARRLSQRVNQYLNDKAPWQLMKTDPARAKTALYVAMQCIDWLKLMWAPILPFSSQRLHEYFGYKDELFGRQYASDCRDEHGAYQVLRYDGKAAAGRWRAEKLAPGQPLSEPKALYTKLDVKDLQSKG